MRYRWQTGATAWLLHRITGAAVGIYLFSTGSFSTELFFPWQGSKVGDISIENIIKVIKSDPAYLEWKQNVTGFKLGFSRHPEYEVYSRNSTHWDAGVA